MADDSPKTCSEEVLLLPHDSMKIEAQVDIQEIDECDDDEEDEERIEDLAIYRLDYEGPPEEEAQQVVFNKEENCRHDNNDNNDDAAAGLQQQQPRAAGGEILKPGDHCYMWCTLYQHHAIVLETFPAAVRIPETTPEHNGSDTTDRDDDAEHDDDDKEQETHQPTSLDGDGGGGTATGGSILIAEFTNVALADAVGEGGGGGGDTPALNVSSLFQSASTAAGATSGGGVQGGFRIILETNPHVKWHKVKYQANAVECLTWRPGTCSAASCLPSRDILRRVHFLYEWGHVLIPNYHLVLSNCETVAVWCVTGQWMTLQGNGAVSTTMLATTLAAAAAATSVALAPVGVALAATSGGLALWRSLHFQKQCHDTAAMLNHQYEWYSMGRTPITFSFQPTTTG